MLAKSAVLLYCLYCGLYCHLCRLLASHRIIKAGREQWVQWPTQQHHHHPKIMSWHLLNTSRYGEPSASLASLCQCLTILQGKVLIFINCSLTPFFYFSIEKCPLYSKVADRWFLQVQDRWIYAWSRPGWGTAVLLGLQPSCWLLRGIWWKTHPHGHSWHCPWSSLTKYAGESAGNVSEAEILTPEVMAGLQFMSRKLFLRFRSLKIGIWLGEGLQLKAIKIMKLYLGTPDWTVFWNPQLLGNSLNVFGICSLSFRKWGCRGGLPCQATCDTTPCAKNSMKMKHNYAQSKTFKTDHYIYISIC